ncbi:sigma-54-dependent Fis family transcriptional regulator, partial [Anoxynatronum sibiricum]
LRDRKEDIEGLTDYFIAKYNSQLKLSVTGMDSECLDAFMNYPWPGNVRELENAIEGAMNLSIGESLLMRDSFPEYIFREAEKNFA